MNASTTSTSASTSTLYNSLFKIGDYVEATRYKKRGWIVGKYYDDVDNVLLLSVRYENETCVEDDIESTNVRVITTMAPPSSSTRSGLLIRHQTTNVETSTYPLSTPTIEPTETPIAESNLEAPTQLDNTVNPPPPLSLVTPPPTTQTNEESVTDSATLPLKNETLSIPSVDKLNSYIKSCFTWTKYKNNNQLYCYIKRGLDKKQGWIKDIISGVEKSEKSHLTKRKNLYLLLFQHYFQVIEMIVL